VNDTKPMKHLSWRELSVSLPVLLFLASAHAAAAEEMSVQLHRCAAITEPTARLACYDTLAAASPASATASATTPVAAAPVTAPITAPGAAPVASGGAAPPEAAGQKTVPMSEFGVRNGPLEAKHAPARPKQMLAAVTRVVPLSRGQVVLTLDNGQIWAQIETKDFPIKVGDPIEIDEASMGSYVAWSPTTRHASKVTRIN
jgi:hypothetical protein